MKKMKRIFALLIAMVMVMGMTTMAFAAQTYTITVKDGYKGETYTAYKVFDVTYNTDKTTYAYKITNTSATGEWFDDIVGSTAADSNGDYTLSAYGIKFQKTSTDGVYNVVNAVSGTNPTADQMAALAVELAKHTSGKTAAGTGKVDWVEGTDAYGAKADVTINVNPDEGGYYFVTTTTGSLCALNTTDANAEVQEKNNQPSLDKKESLTEGTVGSAITYTLDDVKMSIGDTVYFEIEVTDGKGTDLDITIKDTYSSSLTLDADSIKVYKGGKEVVNGDTTWSKTTGTNSFDVVLKAAYVSTLNTGDKVVIRYKATLNENAIINGDETATSYNFNKAHLEYSNQKSSDVEVKQHTYKFQLVKDDSSNKVFTDTTTEGKYATFKMYASETSTDAIALVNDKGVYRLPKNSTEAGSTDAFAAGSPTFSGFGPGTYWFEEVTAPEGYNKLTSRVSITITDSDNMATITDGTYSKGGLEVENQSGAELPSTGGIGTTIFYIIGSILVIGAGVVLVSKRRMNAR